MPTVAVVGSPGMGKTTEILKHFQSFKGYKIFFTYPNKQKDIELFKQCGAHVYTDFAEFMYEVLKHPGCLAACDEADDFFPEEEPKAKRFWNKKEGKIKFIPDPQIQMLSTGRSELTFLYVILHDLKGLRVWMVKYITGLIRFMTNDQLNIQVKRFESWPELVKNLKKNKKIPRFQSFYMPTPSYA